MNTPTARQITDHRLNGLNDAIEIRTIDAPGAGGANHEYYLRAISTTHGTGGAFHHTASESFIYFQKGPINETGINGISNEALLAVVIDRLRGFQHQRKPDGSFDEATRGQYACRENAVALTHCEDALMWLQKRTRARLARGVEGTNQP